MIKEQGFRTMPKQERKQAEKLIMYLYFKCPDNAISDISRKTGFSLSRVNHYLNKNMYIGVNIKNKKAESLNHYEEIKHLIP